MSSAKNGKFTPSYGFGVVDKDGSTRGAGGMNSAPVVQRTTERQPVETSNNPIKESPLTGPMTTPTHVEIDAKLAAVEARMDTRLEKFERAMEKAVLDFRLDVAPLKGMKANIWSGTGIIVASIFAAFTLSFGAFDTGRETSRLVSDARLQQQQIAAEIGALIKDQAAATTASFDAQLAKTQRQINERVELQQTTEKNQKTRAVPGDGQAPESVRTRP